MRNIICNNKKYLKCVTIVILVGVVFGFLYYHFLNSSVKENISSTLLEYNNFRYNSILKDLIITSFLLVASFFIIGIPLSIFYLFYEGFSTSFLINIFWISFGIKGLIYSLIYLIVNKLLKFILMIFFVQKQINIGRYIIGMFLYKNKNGKDKIIINFKNSLYIIVIMLSINIVLFFITPNIFKWLSFLLK